MEARVQKMEDDARRARMQKMKSLAADAEKQSSMMASQFVEAQHGAHAAQSYSAARGGSPKTHASETVVSKREFGRVLVPGPTPISSELTQEIQAHAVRQIEGDKSVTQRSNFYTVDQTSMERVGTPRSPRPGQSGNDIEDLLGELARGDEPALQVESAENRHTTHKSSVDQVAAHQFYAEDTSTRTTEQANEHFHVPQSSWNKSRGMNLQQVESSAEILLSPRSASPRRIADMTLSPRSALEKKSGKWDGSNAKLEQAGKVLPVMESGNRTEEHVYDDKPRVATEKNLPEIVTITSEEVAQKEEVKPIPEFREVQQVVEHIVMVPKHIQKHLEVIKEIPLERTVQKRVEVPRIEKRVIKKQVTKWIEEVVPIPKVIYVDEIIEVPVPVHKVQEVVEVVEQLVPTFVTKEVRKEVIQFNDIIQIVERKQERIIEVPQYTYERKVVEIPVEVIEEEIEYVEVPEIHERVRVVKVEKVVEEIVHRPVTQVVTREVVREVPVIKKVQRVVPIEQIVEVPTKVQIAREVIVEQEQIIEIPRYIVNTNHIYHHTAHAIQYRQKEIQRHRKRIVHYIGEQKQMTIAQEVIHVPKFVEIEVIEWVDLVTERPVEIFKEEIVEVEKIIYEDVEEEVVVEQTRKKFVEVETEQKVTKFVEVPEHHVIFVPKIVYCDNTQVIENIVEVADIVYEDRTVEKMVDVWMDKYVDVPVVKYLEEYVEVPVIKKVKKVVKVPVIEYVDKVVEVPEIKTVTKYVDMHVDVIEEEIVYVPTIRRIEKPELEIVDVEIIVPKIKKVGVLMEINCEVHHDVHEEATSDIIVEIERKEDIVNDRIHVTGGDLEPIVHSTHKWDRTQIPAQFANFLLPVLASDGSSSNELLQGHASPEKEAPNSPLNSPVQEKRETIRRQFQDSDAHSHVRSPRHTGSPKRHVDLSGLDLDGCSPPLPDAKSQYAAESSQRAAAAPVRQQLVHGESPVHQKLLDELASARHSRPQASGDVQDIAPNAGYKGASLSWNSSALLGKPTGR